MQKQDKILAKIYYDTSNSASFGSAQKLYDAAKVVFPLISFKDVNNWLKKQLTYTLHFPLRKKIKRNKIIVNHIDEQWKADLVDLRDLSKLNDQYKYILTVIDCFSKYAFATPLKSKDGKTLVKAFEKIFNNKQCVNMRTDKGTEFLNKDTKALFKKQNINHFTSNNDTIKCAIIERYNRTLKCKMFKYFTATGKKRYIDVLENFITSYNNSKHRSIRMAPNQVNKKNEKIVFKNLYGVATHRQLLKTSKVPALNKGDKVRKKYTIGPLEKGYYPNWSDHIYTVNKTIKEVNPVYKIKDYSGKTIKQRFYNEELQKVEENLHRIEKTIKQRSRKGKKEFLVKWLNYPESYNSWVSEKDIVKFK